MAAKFVLRQDGKDRYLILFQTHSGQVLLTNEARYKDIALCQINATRTYAKNTRNYELHTSAEGWYYFTIKNKLGETLALSDTYSDPESMRQGINQVKGAIRGSRLEDLTIPPPPQKFRRTHKP
jgi:uncharacterized protein YegP (UPF0339 family)